MTWSFFQSSGCTMNKAFISLNLIFCVIVSIISVLPKIQEHNPKSGLLQSSFITLYTMYLTWSAMSNEPCKAYVIFSAWVLLVIVFIFSGKDCNPQLMTIFYPNTTTTPAPVLPATPGPAGTQYAAVSAQSIVGMFIWFACVLYARYAIFSEPLDKYGDDKSYFFSIRSSSVTSVGKITGNVETTVMADKGKVFIGI